MKFAFLIMGGFDSKCDRAIIKDGAATIVGVYDIEDACIAAKELLAEGIDCIELCGAFKEEGTKRIIEATENKIPIGYVTHLKEQDEVYAKAFGINK